MFSGWWMRTAKIPQCPGLVMYRWSLEIPILIIGTARPPPGCKFVYNPIYVFDVSMKQTSNLLMYCINLCRFSHHLPLWNPKKCCWVNRLRWRCSCHLIAALVLLDCQRENCGQRLVAWRRGGDPRWRSDGKMPGIMVISWHALIIRNGIFNIVTNM